MMYLPTVSIIPFLGLMCIFMFISQRRYLLMCLLSLECLILSIIFILILFITLKEMYLLMIILAIAACEASIGLSMVVIMTRYVGNDKIFLLKFFKC